MNLGYIDQNQVVVETAPQEDLTVNLLELIPTMVQQHHGRKPRNVWYRFEKMFRLTSKDPEPHVQVKTEGHSTKLDVWTMMHHAIEDYIPNEDDQEALHDLLDEARYRV